MAKVTQLVFVDVETTGKKGPKTRDDAIVEIAAARVDLASRRILDSFDTLIRPWGDQTVHVDPPDDLTLTWDLGDYHVNAGHFTGVDWTQGVKLSQALDIMRDRFLTDGSTIAGQNPRFDLDHFQRDFARLIWDWPALDYHVIDLCPSLLFLDMAGKIEGCSLRNAVPWAYADPERKQAHRAAADVKDAIRVFFALADYFTKGLRPAPGEGPWT